MNIDTNKFIVEPITDKVSRARYAGLDVLMYTGDDKYKGYINASSLCELGQTKGGKSKEFKTWLQQSRKEGTKIHAIVNEISSIVQICTMELKHEIKGDNRIS